MSVAQIIITSCNRRSLEIEQIKNFLRGNGYSISNYDWDVDSNADVILLSTCGFTEAAEDVGFERLHKVQEQKKPSAKVLFGGCIPSIVPERLAKEFNGLTFNPQTYYKLNKILDAKVKFEEFKRPNTFNLPDPVPDYTYKSTSDFQKAIDILKTYDGSLSGLTYISKQLSNGIRRKLIRTKSAHPTGFKQNAFYIQIQEGCSMGCSYCVIPKALGPLRSKPIEAIIDEFKFGLSRGFKHFELMGDNAGSYGLDIGTNMGHLLNCILAIKGEFDLDLTDISPNYLPTIFESVKELCVQNKLYRLYVAIQSADARILKLMKRNCDMDLVKRMLIDIKKCASPDFRMGTSLIVGFPSETIDELNETIKFCSDVGFDWIWCHSFSARPDTPAALLPNKISDDEILRRAFYVKSQLKGRCLVTTAKDRTGSRTCQG